MNPDKDKKCEAENTQNCLKSLSKRRFERKDRHKNRANSKVGFVVHVARKWLRPLEKWHVLRPLF